MTTFPVRALSLLHRMPAAVRACTHASAVMHINLVRLAV